MILLLSCLDIESESNCCKMISKVNVVMMMVILTVLFSIRGINGGVDDNEIISDDYPSKFVRIGLIYVSC